MRCIAVVLFVSFAAIAAGAQVAEPGGVATVAPVFYGFRNSVIDHNGKVLIFDASYSYPPLLDGPAIPIRFPPIVTTHVTVIASDASGKQDAQYEGTFQVVGVGRYAVYAIITTYPLSATSGQASTSVTRQLVAIGPKFPELPSIDVSFQSDVKISAIGDGKDSDTIALVDSVITPLLGAATGTVEPLPPTPVKPRTVQMYRSDGMSFTPLPPVALPTP